MRKRIVYILPILFGLSVFCAAGTARSAEASAHAPQTPTAESGVAEKPGADASADLCVVRDFEKDDTARFLWEDEAGNEVMLKPIDAAHGESLGVPVLFPSVTEVWRRSRPEAPFRLALGGRTDRSPAVVIRLLEYEVFVPRDLPNDTRVQARLLLKTKDGIWFEALGRRWQNDKKDGRWVPATALHPGWNRIRVDLSHDSVDLRPRHHQMRWSRHLLWQVQAMGFAFQADKPYGGLLAVDNLRAWKATDRPQEPAAAPGEPAVTTLFAEPLRVTDFAVLTPAVARYDLYETAFTVNRPLLNPFRQDEIAVDAVINRPDGTAVTVPAFYYQDFRRVRGSDTPGAVTPDAYIPSGPARFRVRFTPRQSGTYRYRLSVRFRSPVSGVEETIQTEGRTFAVADRSHPGFLRVSPEDPLCFEFENGDYFFPIGHSFRSPVDPRHYERIQKRFYPEVPERVDTGLRTYELLLPRMETAGINCFEVWMASWWLGIEWTGRWKNYHGLGVYNLEHAWKLDRLLDLAARHGQYVHLTIDNHGKAAQNLDRGKPQVDHEFEFSPYSRDNPQDGGFLRLALHLFTNPRAQAHYKDKYRYIAARWGYSTRILGFEMWSELDLIGHKAGRHRDVYASAAVRSWHQVMRDYFAEQDHGNHLVTTHYSGDYNVIDWGMVRLPQIDYIVCDAYHNTKTPLMRMLARTEASCLNRSRVPDPKPYWVTEFGGDWNASTLEGLLGDLYGGLWFGWTSHMAGTPLYWWFEFLHQKDLFSAYAALAKFTAGEDKRRGPDDPQLVTAWPVSLGSPNNEHKRLETRVLADGRVFYLYVYDEEQIRHLPLKAEGYHRYDGVVLVLRNVEPAPYGIEVWSPWTGERIKTIEMKPDAGGSLAVELPPFAVQLALKIKRIGD